MKFETIKHIFLSEYISYYFAEKKPKNWQQINDEMNELTGTDDNRVFVDLYRRYLKLQIKRDIQALNFEDENERENFEISRIENDLAKLQKEKTSKQSTEKDFGVWIAQVSRYAGFHIKRNEITLFDFLILSNEWQTEIDIKTKQYQRERENKRHNRR